MTLTVEPKVDFLVFSVKDTQFLIDLFLVVSNKDWGTQESIDGEDNAWKCWHDANASCEESGETNDGENDANEVGLEHVDCNAGLKQELKESNQVESQEKEGKLLAVLSSNEIQVNLRENEADGNDLSRNESTLVESILAPALHGESLENREGNLVVLLREAEGAVWVSHQGQNHADHVEVITLLELQETADGED